MGCLATSFTFDADMFSRDCLARFLGLTTAYGEGDRASDLSLMIEEEERLGEATVTVLVDRSYRAEPRNLRWDIVPVVVQGGLLHAKSAVLLWERAMRLIIGSANLTPAGYRRQVEMVAGFDFTPEESDLPVETARQLLSEIRLIATDLVPEVAAGPRTRMLKTLDLANQRLLDAPAGSSRDFRWAVAPVRTGKKALEGFDEVWRGSQPRECVALSPFWDGEPGNAEVNGVAAIASLLSRRKNDGTPSRIELAVAVDVAEGGRIVRAPASLTTSIPASIESQTVIFDPGDAERRLHAKWISYRNDGWIAAMFGSSNLTAKGLGLDRLSHRELNLWLATSSTSKAGKQLASMIRDDGSIELADELCDIGEDEDESALIPLPMGFVDVSIEGSLDRATLRFHFDSGQLPGTWTILQAEGAGDTLLTSNTWNKASTVVVPLSSSVLPATVLVQWHDAAGVHHEAPWVVNVDDLRILPPPAELHDLTVDALLTVLASSRPLRQILEAEFRRAEQHTAPDNGQAIDPLKRYVNSSFLLPRVPSPIRRPMGPSSTTRTAYEYP